MILLEPFGQETRATGFLGEFQGVYAGQDAESQWVLYWMWLFLDKSGQGGLLLKLIRDASASESNFGRSESSSNNGKEAVSGSCWWRHFSAVNCLTTSDRFNICCRSSVVTS